MSLKLPVHDNMFSLDKDCPALQGEVMWNQSHTASSASSSRHRPVFNHWALQLRLNLAALHSI